MGAIIGMLVGKRIFGQVIGEKAARFIAIGGLVLALILAMGAAKCAYDRNVIEKHEAKQEAATAKADRKADQKAAEQRRADDSRLAQEATELRKVQDNAKTDTDRRLAKHRCLRLQQAARRERREPPSCS